MLHNLLPILFAGVNLIAASEEDGQAIVASPPLGDVTPGSMTPGTLTPGSVVSEPLTPGCAVGQVKGGGGGDKQAQRRVLKGNATGLHMLSNTNLVLTAGETPPMVNGGTGRKWAYSTVGKDKLAR